MENRRERESRKQKLRERMIDNERMDGGGYADEMAAAAGEEAERIRRARKKRKRLRAVIICLLAAVAAAGFLGYRYYERHHQYQSCRVVWEKEIGEGSFSGYEQYGENVLKYTRDGAVYYSRTGEEIWNQAYEMQSPFASTSGDYAVIADRNGYSIYICDKSGCQGVVTTTLPISKVAVSSTGVTVAILEDSQSNYIAFYDKSGTKLQIEVQTTLSGNGYPLDLSISPNGMLLMVSYVYLDEGAMQNQVVFYNFDEEGQNIKDRLIGGFREYGSSMVAKVQFLDNTHACAFAEDRICFYSLENTVQPEMIRQIDVEDEIASILYSDQYAGVITGASGEDKTMTVYGKDGDQVFETAVSMGYDEAGISGSSVILYREAECAIYNMSGNLKYQGTLDGSIAKVIGLGGNRYIQITPQAMKELELR